MSFEEYEMLTKCKDAAKPIFIKAIKDAAERHAREKQILGNRESLIRYILEEVEGL